MEKSIVHCLPPLVQGKLSGVFELAVEKIKITEKILKNENSSLLVRISWWGENEPLFVRPNKIQFITKDNNEIVINEPSKHSIKYEVHTNLKLFKAYLEKCEVVELVILNSLENEVIGSTILHDLIHLIFYTPIFNSSIINHSGNPIGEISCQLSFEEVSSKESLEGIQTNITESPAKKWSVSNLKINLNTLNLHSPREETDMGSDLNKENNSNGVFHEFPTFSKNVLDNLYSQRSSNLHYNSPVTQNSELKFDSKCTDISEYSDKKTEPMNDHLKKSNISSHIDSTKAVNLNIPMDLERSEKPFTIDSSRDISKTTLPVKPFKSLHINVKDKKKIIDTSKNTYLVNKRQEENMCKNKTCNIGHSKKVINKKAITSKVKSYIENKTQKNKNDNREKAFLGSKKNQKNIVNSSNITGNQRGGKITNAVVKPIANVKSFAIVSKEISKLNKLYLNPSKDSNNDHSDLERVPIKEDISSDDAQDHDSLESISKKGKDYEKNINATKSSVNCGSGKINTKDYDSEIFNQNKPQSNYPLTLEKVNVDNKLHFNLNDPIEKIYYETFFLKTENVCNNEFEIAELLNQPENKYILELTQRRALSGNEQLDNNHIFPEKGNVNNQNSQFFSDKDDVRKEDRTSKETLTDPPRIRKDEEYKCELPEPIKYSTQNSNSKSKSQREYEIDCHRCKYHKKLCELDKIIESLRIFETRLKNEVVLSSLRLSADDNAKNFTDDLPLLSKSNSPVQTVIDSKFSKMEHSDEEPALGFRIDGSDFSKEDSDFIEFTHYLSKR